jgi:hypothetical protein
VSSGSPSSFPFPFLILIPNSDVENKPFRVPQTDEYLLECSDYQARFLVFIMRASSDPGQYPQALLTTEQIDAAKALDAALDEPGVQLMAPIHSLAYTLMSSCPPEVSENQFLSPHILYLISSNMRRDHVTETPEAISKCLSKLTWVIRATAVYEALLHRDDYADGLLG